MDERDKATWWEIVGWSVIVVLLALTLWVVKAHSGVLLERVTRAFYPIDVVGAVETDYGVVTAEHVTARRVPEGCTLERSVELVDLALLDCGRLSNPLPIARESYVGEDVYLYGKVGQATFRTFFHGIIGQKGVAIDYGPNNSLLGADVVLMSDSGPGTSGSPIVNAQGELVGIVSGGNEWTHEMFMSSLENIRAFLRVKDTPESEVARR